MSSELKRGKVHSPFSSNPIEEGMALNDSADKDCGKTPATATYAETAWVIKTVGELVAENVLAPPLDGNHGAIHPKGADFIAAGIPFIMASDMKDGEVDIKGCSFISPQQAATLRKGFSKKGDVLLSHKATIGRTALVGDIPNEFLVLTPQVTYYRVLNRNVLNNRYLKYYFDSRPFQETLESWAGAGSTRAYLGITAQRKLPIVLPPIQIQNEIASVIGTLDDRIALLRETNATLEAMAQALFKSWFVDFDPVHANAGTRAATLPAELQALFPSAFTDTPQGLVPDGWQVGVVGDVAQQKKGSINPMQAPERLFEHYSLPAFDSNQVPVLEQGEKIKSNKTPLPPNAVLLSKLNPHIPRVWLPFGYSASAVCSTEFLVYSPTNGASKEFIYALFTSVNFLMNLQQLVTGTSNSHQRVRPDHVVGLELVIPSQDILAEFESAVKPLFERIGHNRQQAQTLATLRDTLLPRLISGQLRLPDAAAALVEAGA